MAANLELILLKAFTGLIQGNFRLAYKFWDDSNLIETVIKTKEDTQITDRICSPQF